MGFDYKYVEGLWVVFFLATDFLAGILWGVTQQQEEGEIVMVMEDIMQHSSVKIDNLANYVCIDEDGNPSDQGMGRVLEISMAKASLETHVPIESSNILLTISGMKKESKVIDIKGRVIYCKEIEPKTFQTGIQLLGSSERIKQTVVNMIKVFNMQNETDG